MMSNLGKIDTELLSLLGAFSILPHLVFMRFTVASLPARRGANQTQPHVLWSQSTGFFFLFLFSLHNSPTSHRKETPQYPRF